MKEKKEYKKPILTVYGDVKSITRNGGGCHKHNTYNPHCNHCNCGSHCS